MKITNQRGFTLVEIMIVVVIIGLLASMAVPAFQKIRSTSQDKTVINNLRQLASGADQYFLEEGETTVTSSILAGSGSTFYVKKFKLVANEEYPATINSTTTSLTLADKGSLRKTLSIAF